ncbi:hypothetical protein P7228_00165 [Altererythrobacter arenosus]|uniref:MBL fold metallo-hydrolase n=1 Tax=Altererythrobacter arenosus TaxID=3032592 RepID=A0ABY8FR69_9SPHN|nr:hypothetical protein [Altererythrobacter sp. CAU 1644]WFL77513.1 hypothetical protein P7228_00165 [Altererythrobacter sp. CAU 1644]
MRLRFSRFSTIFGAAVSVAALSSQAWAGEAEDAVIAQVTEAYGGSDLTDMQSIRVRDHYKTAFPGQGYTSRMVEFTHLKQDAQLDLANQRGSVEGWSANWNFTFNTRTVSAGDDIAIVNYISGDYQPAAFADYFAAYGAVIRVTDTLLAYHLAKSADSATHKGTAMYLGRPHAMIEFQLPSSPPLTLYVDQETGLISKSERVTPFGSLTYTFGNHATQGGVSYARDFEFFIGDDVNLLSLSREISVNGVDPAIFAIDSGIVAEPARLDQAEMTTDEIAAGVHLVGQGPQGGAAAYTTFVDAGDHLIAVGGYAGLQARYDAYKEATGSTKPIRYQVVTHHHTDHLGGMADALGLGAIFVTPENAVANVRTAAGADIPEDRLMVLDGSMTLGPVQIYDVATNHMESMALVYIPAASAIFQADHYTGLYEGAAPTPVGAGTVYLKNHIEALGLDVATILSAHGRKAVTWEEFSAAVAGYDGQPCKSGRPICSGG